jgi:hypothetical protein
MRGSERGLPPLLCHRTNLPRLAQRDRWRRVPEPRAHRAGRARVRVDSSVPRRHVIAHRRILVARGDKAIGIRTIALPAATGQANVIGVQAHVAGVGAIASEFLAHGENDQDPGQIGVSGQADGPGGIGVEGFANNGTNGVGVLGSSTSGLAGRFDGNVQVTGNAHATGKITRAYTAGTSNQATPIAYGAIAYGGGVTGFCQHPRRRRPTPLPSATRSPSPANRRRRASRRPTWPQRRRGRRRCR